MKKFIAIGLAAILLTGCAGRNVQPAMDAKQINNVCIEINPAVQVDDFLSALQSAFYLNGVKSETYFGTRPQYCEYVVKYTARRSWDVVPYLAYFNIVVEKDNVAVAYGEWKIKFMGRFSLAKWKDSSTLVHPIVKRMLIGKTR